MSSFGNPLVFNAIVPSSSGGGQGNWVAPDSHLLPPSASMEDEPMIDVGLGDIIEDMQEYPTSSTVASLLSGSGDYGSSLATTSVSDSWFPTEAHIEENTVTVGGYEVPTSVADALGGMGDYTGDIIQDIQEYPTSSTVASLLSGSGDYTSPLATTSVSDSWLSGLAGLGDVTPTYTEPTNVVGGGYTVPSDIADALGGWEDYAPDTVISGDTDITITDEDSDASGTPSGGGGGSPAGGGGGGGGSPAPKPKKKKSSYLIPSLIGVGVIGYALFKTKVGASIIGTFT